VNPRSLKSSPVAGQPETHERNQASGLDRQLAALGAEKPRSDRSESDSSVTAAPEALTRRAV
jgi:hypothetical protein